MLALGPGGHGKRAKGGGVCAKRICPCCPGYKFKAANHGESKCELRASLAGCVSEMLDEHTQGPLLEFFNYYKPQGRAIRSLRGPC